MRDRGVTVTPTIPRRVTTKAAGKRPVGGDDPSTNPGPRGSGLAKRLKLNPTTSERTVNSHPRDEDLRDTVLMKGRKEDLRDTLLSRSLTKGDLRDTLLSKGRKAEPVTQGAGSNKTRGRRESRLTAIRKHNDWVSAEVKKLQERMLEVLRQEVPGPNRYNAEDISRREQTEDSKSHQKSSRDVQRESFTTTGGTCSKDRSSDSHRTVTRTDGRWQERPGGRWRDVNRGDGHRQKAARSEELRRDAPRTEGLHQTVAQSERL